MQRNVPAVLGEIENGVNHPDEGTRVSGFHSTADKRGNKNINKYDLERLYLSEIINGKFESDFDLHYFVDMQTQGGKKPAIQNQVSVTCIPVNNSSLS